MSDTAQELASSFDGTFSAIRHKDGTCSLILRATDGRERHISVKEKDNAALWKFCMGELILGPNPGAPSNTPGLLS